MEKSSPPTIMIQASLTTFRNAVHMHGRAARALTAVQPQPHHRTSQHGLLPVHRPDARLLSSAAAASQRVALPAHRPNARLLSSAASEELGSILTREINEETDASPEGTMVRVHGRKTKN